MITNKKQVQGLTLIEVLITVLVVAIGMLGMAALQVKTLTSTQESYARSQAVSWLSDASSRIMANREFFATESGSFYTSESNSGVFNPWCEVTGEPYEPQSTCTGSCSGKDLALSDIDSLCSSMHSSGIQGAQIGAACNDRDGSDTDPCSSGSKLTIYAAWPQVNRDDMGDQAITTQRCASVLADDAPPGYSCAIVELIP